MTESHLSHSFVARIWLEREPQGAMLWRGHIRHVQSDREDYFGTLAELRAFLEEVTGVAGPVDASSAGTARAGRSRARRPRCAR